MSAKQLFAIVLVLCVALLPVHATSTSSRVAKRCRLYWTHVLSGGDDLLGPSEIQRMARLVDEDVRVSVRTAERLIAALDRDGNRLLDADEWCARMTGDAVIEQDLDDSPYAPQQVHLMTTPSLSEMSVNWLTDENTTDSVVEFGLQLTKLNNTAYGSTTTYHAGWAFPFDGTLHGALLTSLSPSTRYYYRVGSRIHNQWSQVFNFTTRSPNPTNTRFALVGDVGTAIPFGFEVLAMVRRFHQHHPFDFVLHVGDLAYAGVDSPDVDELEFIWGLWMDEIEQIAAYVPYMTSVGNHERYFNYTSYEHRFAMPGPQTGGNTSFWWSQTYGNVHITSMSTEHPYEPGSTQYAWIESDLAATDADWKILAGHRPMYSSDQSEYSSHSPGAPLQTEIQPLMIKNNVSMYLSGHMHCFERTYPVINATTFKSKDPFVYENPEGPFYIVQGNSGVFLFEDWVEPQPEWSASRLQEFGFGIFDLNATTLTYEMWIFPAGGGIEPAYLGDSLTVIRS